VIALLLALALLDVRPLSTAQICATKWSLDVRHVTVAQKRHVFALAGVRWSDRSGYIVDHRVPRELGGTDTLANLWLQTKPEAHKKDVIENRLHRAVCLGTITLNDAQQDMRTWR